MAWRWLVAILAVALLPAASCAQDKFQVFAGYAYVRTADNVVVDTTPPPATQSLSADANLNGWEASLRYAPFPGFGFVADFGGGYGSLPTNSANLSLHRTTYMFGPEFASSGRFSPFVHFLFGVVQESRAAGPTTPQSFIPAYSGHGFANCEGAGLDISVSPHISLRAIQADFLTTETHSSCHAQPRFSAGVLFHF
jgi:hypothetical protein